MSENDNVIQGDFDPNKTVRPEEKPDLSPVDHAPPPSGAFFDLTQEQILALEPLGEAEIKEVLKQHPRIARNFYNLSEQFVKVSTECGIRGRLLAGLIYQSGGKITIDCLPMSRVRGDEGFTMDEGRFKSTVVGFRPRMVSGSKTIIQG